ncbi:MAG: hypothetical protein ACE5HT_01100 [Gemmatimonadales bacterium]
MSVITPDGSDTVRVVATRLESLTEEITAVAGDRYSVRLTYDSVRARLRPAGGTWKILDPGPREEATVRVVLGPTMQVLASAEYIDQPNVNVSDSEALRGMAGGFQLSLPDTLVAVGGSWTAELKYPITVLASVAGDLGVPNTGELMSLATVTLDSVTARGTDRLSYMTVRGRFHPTRIESSAQDAGVADVAGSLVATLIWSSGWNAYVSGGVRMVINLVTYNDTNDKDVTSRLRFEIATQFQLRA